MRTISIRARFRISERWVPLANRLLAGAVTAALAVFAYYEVKSLVWPFFEARSADLRLPQQGAPPRLEDTNAETLAAAHLFGSPADGLASPQPKSDTTTPASTTTQDLALAGVLLVTGGRRSGAIISVGHGKQHVYLVGEPIEGLPDVTLRSVQRDYAVVDRDGRPQRIELSADKAAGATVAAARLVPPEPRDDLDAPEGDRFSTEPRPVEAVLTMWPTMAPDPPGLRLTATKDEKDLASLGVATGDIVTEFDSEPVLKPDVLKRFKEALESHSLVHITALRNGAEMRIFIDTRPLLAP